MNDLAYTVDLASPMFPQAFLVVACLGSLARACVGVAGGATRAALTVHFARSGNAADIAAKEQAQETCVTALGMLLGIATTRLFSANVFAAWVLFSVLTAVHVWANVRAMRCLVLTSVNQPRLEGLLAAHTEKGVVLTPREMAVREDLTPPPFARARAALLGDPRPIRLGVRLGAAATECAGGLAGLLAEQGHRRYLATFPSVTAELEAAGWQLGHVRLPRARWTAEWKVTPRRAKKED
ncbi:hypothetical protein FOA52_008860 [Chlamydomonas sp. UWO 241]|nr:hypothetical protein FOA52_008860 [Chlamydomonas sp. UWO 241]